MANTFAGGVHVHDFKEFTNHNDTVRLDDCPVLTYPIRQHIGAPLDILVKKGDRVTVGQKLADKDTYMAVPVHSSVSGTVKDITRTLLPNGTFDEAVVVENDFEYTMCESVKPPVKDYTILSPKEVLWLIREGGLVGLGGAGFPTHVKLAPPEDTKIDILIVNGAECEPFITADHRRMIEDTEDIIEGVKVAMFVLGINKACIGIETNKRDAIVKMKRCIEDKQARGINVIELKPKYPQGAEKQLIKAVTGREVPEGGLPAAAGVVVINIDTCRNIANAVLKGIPVIEKIVTVSGDCVKQPSNFKVPTGVPVSYLFEKAGGFEREPAKIIMGGPMMGTAQYSTDVPVTKTTSSVLALSSADEIYDDGIPCIRCGKCVENCPMHLMPCELNKLALKHDFDGAEKYHITDCIECGVCSYTCPSKENMLANIKIAKFEVISRIKRRQSK